MNERKGGFRLPPLPEDEVDRTTSASIACVALGGAIAAVILLASARAHGADRAEFWLELFAGDRGGVTASEMRWQAASGPFRDVIDCYVAGALSLGSLARRYPDKIFMARCDGGIVLAADAMMDRAIAFVQKSDANSNAARRTNR